MENRDLDYFRQKLLDDKRAQLRQIEDFDEMNKIDYADGKELSMIDNHPAEIASETYEISKNMALKQEQVMHLKEIDEALQNIDTGQYGVCKGCGKDIPMERMRLMPTAIRCVDCQKDNEIITGSRPIEERSLYPPFGRTNLDETDDVAYDGEDTWQDVARYNKTENKALDWYDNNWYDNE
ncbi:MAG: yteA family sporulation protein [Clostridiales bacterium]|nr:yteA family sporulation protein [Clostridiales bacterium]